MLMEVFGQTGFSYKMYRLDPGRNVSVQSYALPTPFPAVNKRMIERVIVWGRRQADLPIEGLQGMQHPSWISKDDSVISTTNADLQRGTSNIALAGTYVVR